MSRAKACPCLHHHGRIRGRKGMMTMTMTMMLMILLVLGLAISMKHLLLESLRVVSASSNNNRLWKNHNYYNYEEQILASLLHVSPSRNLRRQHGTSETNGRKSPFPKGIQQQLHQETPSLSNTNQLQHQQNVTVTTAIGFQNDTTTTTTTTNHPDDDYDNDDDDQIHMNTTVLAMISFGNATRQNHVQRCIRSARARGQWKGRIVVLTDAPQRYARLVQHEALVHVLVPRAQDWQDLPQFHDVKIKYKRFKTRLIDYVLADARLNNVNIILYMDVDIVVGKPILPWLQTKWQQTRQERQRAPADMSITYMFATGNGGKAAHSGVILLHTALSNGCMTTWRRRLDASRLTVHRDQQMLRFMRRAGAQKTKCRITLWPKKELIFPLQEDFEQRRFAQFVHITNTFHAGQTNALLQQAFLEDALNLTRQERQNVNSLAIVPEQF